MNSPMTIAFGVCQSKGARVMGGLGRLRLPLYTLPIRNSVVLAQLKVVFHMARKLITR